MGKKAISTPSRSSLRRAARESSTAQRRFWQEYLSGWVANRVILDITNELYDRVQGLSIAFFTNLINRRLQYETR